jgi:hypothetical protein
MLLGQVWVLRMKKLFKHYPGHISEEKNIFVLFCTPFCSLVMLVYRTVYCIVKVEKRKGAHDAEIRF